MLVLRLEMWPGGNPNKMRPLGTLRISNVGGDGDEWSYQVELDKSEGRSASTHRTTVHNWVGVRDAWALVHESLTRLGVMGWKFCP